MNSRKIMINVLFMLLVNFIIAQFRDSVNARVEFDKRHYNRAAMLYSRMLVSEPSNLDLISYRAICYYNLKKYESTITDCNKVINSKTIADNKKNFFYKIRGFSYYMQADYEKSLIDLNNYTSFNDENELYNLLGNIYSKLEDYSEAIRYYKLSFELFRHIDSNKAYTLAQIGDCYYYMDSLLMAKSYLQRAQQVDSNHLEVLLLKGFILVNERKLEAISFYEERMKHFPKEYVLAYAKGIAHSEFKQFDLALKAFNYYLNKTKDSIYVMPEIAEVYMHQKKYSLAINTYRYVLNHKPNSSNVNNSMACHYYNAKNYNKAMYYSDKAIELDQNNKFAKDTKGQIYFMIGKYSSAIQSFDDALKIDSTYSHSLFLKAASYLQLNNTLEACKTYKKIMKLHDNDLEEGNKKFKDKLDANCAQ